jgi:hypothetical protein
MHPVLNMSKGLWWLPFSYIVARVLGRVSEVSDVGRVCHTRNRARAGSYRRGKRQTSLVALGRYISKKDTLWYDVVALDLLRGVRGSSAMQGPGGAGLAGLGVAPDRDVALDITISSKCSSCVCHIPIGFCGLGFQVITVL